MGCLHLLMGDEVSGQSIGCILAWSTGAVGGANQHRISCSRLLMGKRFSLRQRVLKTKFDINIEFRLDFIELKCCFTAFPMDQYVLQQHNGIQSIFGKLFHFYVTNQPLVFFINA